VIHTLTSAWTRTGETVSVSKEYTVEGEQNVDVEVPASTTNKEVNIDLDVSELKTLMILSDVAVTIKTNSSGSPDDTLTVPANTPVMWGNDTGITCPLGTDVTKVYITNATTGAATVKIRAGYDATP
jgi:hypothetical protein